MRESAASIVMTWRRTIPAAACAAKARSQCAAMAARPVIGSANALVAKTPSSVKLPAHAGDVEVVGGLHLPGVEVLEVLVHLRGHRHRGRFGCHWGHEWSS